MKKSELIKQQIEIEKEIKKEIKQDRTITMNYLTYLKEKVKLLETGDIELK